MDESSETGQPAAPQPNIRLVTAGMLLIAASLGVLITTKDPGQGGPLVVLLFLLLVFLLLLLGSVAVLTVVARKTKAGNLSWLRLLYTSVAIAAGAVFLVGLQTLRQLQVIDIVLVVVFEVLLNFYLLRRF